jgi:hypothetical protein
MQPATPKLGLCSESGSSIQCTSNGWSCVANPGTPIVIDTKGEGFHLTSLEGGVRFEFFPGKPKVQLSWTDAAFGNGFLVLDRNHNGVIDDGSELFGNETPQPPLSNPNGYNALTVYDDPANGGNDNGVIDPGDAVYSSLRVWIDRNHDGVSEPGELFSLAELGISELGLRYRESRRVDSFGNIFRYTAPIGDGGDGHPAKRDYDVILLVGSPRGSSARSCLRVQVSPAKFIEDASRAGYLRGIIDR